MFSLSMAVLLAATAQAQGHTHGRAELAIAVQSDGDVLVELHSPAANIVGFEYAPRTDEEHAFHDSQLAELTRAPGVVAFDRAAQCALTGANVLSSQAHDDHDAGHGHDDHDGHHDHDEHHDHEDHDDHDAHDEGGAAHSDIRVQFTYHCERPARIRQVSTDLFERFGGIESIDAILITEDIQTAARLNAASNSFAVPTR